MKKLRLLLFGMAFLFGMVGISNATLIDNFNDTITHQTNGSSIIWLKDAYYLSYATNWGQATNLVNNLEFQGYTDWRLPTKDELLSLYNDENISVGNFWPFSNLRPGYYWSSTEFFPPEMGASAMDFTGNTGYQSKDQNFNVWAVHDSGGAAPVPEPATLFLFGSGIVGLAVYRKRLKRNKS